MHLALRTLTALAAAATVSTIGIGIAEAAPTGRVVAQTQKMTGPSLKTTQVGWYPAGAQLTLQCYERGQSVKGALSKYHPNGGWDDLWYRTSDGVYVADIDIETGSNDPVTGPCSQPPASQPGATTPSSSKVDAAIAWATNQVGSQRYPRLCVVFVQDAYGLSPQGADAMAWYNAAVASGQIHRDSNYPRGAIVFSKSYLDGGQGHVLIALGNGKFVSGGVAPTMRGGNGSTVQILSSPNPTPGATILGWIAPPN